MVPAWNIQRPIRPTQLLAVCLAAPLAIFRHSLLSDIGKILRQSAFALLICAFTGMAAGIFLGSMANTLQLLPGLIILIPGAMALRGDIFASMGARLGTYLHTGQISRSREHSPVLRENVLSSIAQTLVLSLALGLLAAGVASLVGIDVISPAAFIVISVLAGLLAAALLPIITFAVSMGSFKRGWDPDNVTAPLITASGDMIAIPAVFLAAHVVLYIETVEGVFIDMIAMALIVLAASFLIAFVPRKKVMTKILKQSIPVLLICAVLATFSGIFLEASLDSLVVFTALLILLPPFNEEAGNLGAILASRLSSAALLGTTKMGRIPDREAMKSILAISMLVLAIFPMLGVMMQGIAVLAGFSSPGLVPIVKVALFAGVIISVVATTTAYYFTYFSYRIGVDPDNVVIPLITATMDIVGTVVLLFSLHLFGVI